MSSTNHLQQEDQSLIADDAKVENVHKVEYEDYFAQIQGVMFASGDGDNGGDGTG